MHNCYQPNSCNNNCYQSNRCSTAKQGGYHPMETCTCHLAIANVPWQQLSETYEPEQAFRTGTIFPELDKPFLGRSVRT